MRCLRRISASFSASDLLPGRWGTSTRNAPSSTMSVHSIRSASSANRNSLSRSSSLRQTRDVNEIAITQPMKIEAMMIPSGRSTMLASVV